MPSDSEDEDADQVTAVPNLPHISAQRDINVTDTDSDSHGDRMLTRRLRGRQTLPCLLLEEHGPCCRQFEFQQIAAGRMGFHGRLTVYYRH